MDYKNGKIHSIRSYQTENIYIGSTIQQLSKRLSKHKSNYKLWKDGKYHYVSSYEILKYEDYYIELIEIYPCETKIELEKREGELIRQNNNAINKIIVGRTPKEYQEYNKDKFRLKRLEKYNNNKDKINLQSRKLRNKNKDIFNFNRRTKNKRNKKMNQLNLINKMWLDFQ